MSTLLPPLLNPEPIAATTRSAFAIYPWCMQLLDDPRFIPVQTSSGIPTPSMPKAFFCTVLRGPDAIQAVQSFYLPPPAAASQLLPSPTPHEPFPPASDHLGGEIHTLYILGTGVSGHAGIAHGGLVATLLDQQAGSLIVADPATGRPRTAFCNVRYARGVPVPGAVRVRAWKTKVEGRKHWVAVELMDGEGAVLASAEIMLVNGKGSL